MAEPIEMPFWVVGSRNHVLDVEPRYPYAKD